MRIYLDHNATTPLDPEVRAAIVAVLDVCGNPSSQHAEGRLARDFIEQSRRHVADLLGGLSEEIIFCSGGTEADCLGLIGLARLGRAEDRPARVLAAASEHPAITGAVRALADEGFEPVTLAVDERGVLDLDALERACRAGAAVLAVALANHELGTWQDLPAVVAIAHEHGVRVHCDAVQALGKRPVRVADLGVDSLALSAHKIYGPKGAGALWVRAGLDLAPLVAAGHQERERRPGTENLLGIVGLGAAAQLTVQRGPLEPEVRTLADQLERGLLEMSHVTIHGAGAERVGNTVNAGFRGALGETIAQSLDLAGFAVSTGAACTSGSVEPSPVLLALGLSPERAVEAVRFSLGRGNTAVEVEKLLEVLPDIVSRSRAYR